MDGALLIDKPEGISSFGVIEELQKVLRRGGGGIHAAGLKRKDLPKLGHGGTLDPFATGLLVVCVGRAVKLARYFLGSSKAYEGVMRFGETTVPGDPTSEISERSDVVPESIAPLRELAARLQKQPYLQTPPMHSAKKVDGRPLYKLARQGIEIEREPKLCHLHELEISEYSAPRARFRLQCSSGTYVRTLAQDFGRLLGSVAMLEQLRRTGSGAFRLDDAWTLAKIAEHPGSWEQLPCWRPFDALMEGYDRAQATNDEAAALLQGRQNVLFSILKRVESSTVPRAREDHVAIFSSGKLVAVAKNEGGVWSLERAFAD
jgi:tRNA pseudouridine55 synthase